MFRRLSRLPLVLAVLLVAVLLSVPSETAQDLANLGYARLWEGSVEGPGGAVRLFERALAADPAFPYRWSDLGQALAEAGQPAQAGYCFDRAVQLAPASPQIAIRAANFYLSHGDPARAAALFSTALAETSRFDDMVFTSFRKFAGPLDRIWSPAFRGNPRVARSFFRFLLARGTEPELRDAWRKLEAAGLASQSEAYPWTAWLLDHGGAPEAALVWARHAALDPTAYRVSNWLDNPGFESGFRAKGFDWTAEPFPGVESGPDSSRAHSGTRSLRLDFDAPAFDAGNEYRHVYQHVVLAPGRYRLEGWLRTDSLTTDEGIRLQLAAPGRPGPPLAATRGLTGTSDWTLVGTDFEIPASHPKEGALFRVEIARHRSWSFVNRPSGHAWADDIRLSPVPPGTPAGRPRRLL